MGRAIGALVVAAHPDDEVIGAGIWMHRHCVEPLYVVHITDGSPADMTDARALGFASREAYAAARRMELKAALRLVPLPVENCFQLNVTDKETLLHLPEIVAELEGLVRQLNPRLVLSPAYEGGHPDHDSAAFAVAAVRRRGPAFEHREYPLYHADVEGRMITGSFIGDSAATEVLDLSESEQSTKRAMFECFETQRQMLGHFETRRECFRRAPDYDFNEKPHPGPLLYERWGWGIDGSEWRRCAKEAL